MIPNTGISKYAVFKRDQLTGFDFIKAYFQNISCLHVHFFFLMHNVPVKGEAEQMENTITDSSLNRGKHPMVALQKLILYTLLDEAQPQIPCCLYTTDFVRI